MTKPAYMVVGDCGGTNTRLAMWEIDPSSPSPKRGERAPGKLIKDQKYLNEDHESFLEVMKTFIKECNGVKPETACLACAGPIVDNTVSFTNIASGWEINGTKLGNELSIPEVKLLNDFEAMGYGLLTLSDEECYILHKGEAKEGGVIATAGAGTGLGECFLTKDPSAASYVCWATEGGHTDFSPRTDLEVELLRFLKAKFVHKYRVSHERVISGIGISNVYEFLSEKYPDKVDPKIHEEWQAADSMKGGVIAKHAKSDALCEQALQIVFQCFASECGNVCLKYLPYGGFFITGGLAAKNVEWIKSKVDFLGIMFDKGRVSPALHKIPVKLVLTEDCGERGAHLVGFNLLKSLHS